MATRIERDGWVISGETKEELALGIEAVQRVLSGKPAENGHQVRRNRISPLNKPAATGDDDKTARFRKTSLAFLRAIQAAGTSGVMGDALVIATHAKSGKALGTVIGGVNRLLKEAGMRPETVYSSQRTPAGKQWIAKQKIADAIAALEEAG